jgi:hypothetical protein
MVRALKIIPWAEMHHDLQTKAQIGRKERSEQPKERWRRISGCSSGGMEAAAPRVLQAIAAG